MTVAPSGEQFEIASGDQQATIVEVGGGIREYEVGGRLVLDPYPVDAMCDGAHGNVLVPWPNRLADGRYRFDGVDYQVALTEPRESQRDPQLLALAFLARCRAYAEPCRHDDDAPPDDGISRSASMSAWSTSSGTPA